MKKLLFCLVLCLNLLLFAYADDDLSKVSRNLKIQEAVKLLKDFPANGSYKRIVGYNPTNKPIKIEFKNPIFVNSNYKNFDALGLMADKKLYIYINSKHKEAPKEAISALISNAAVHIDKTTSLNEEAFACALEAVVWNYLTSKNLELRDDPSPLVKRENSIEELYIKSPENISYIISSIQNNSEYRNLKSESNGYSNKDFNKRIERLYQVYSEFNNLDIILDKIY